MATPAVDIVYSVFLPGRMVLSQSAVDYQLAHADEFNCEGLNTYTITLMSIVTVAVALRLWSRRIARIDWRSDDYTLVAGWVRFPFHKTCDSYRQAVAATTFKRCKLLTVRFRYYQ